jgi:F420-0:gamma-glutamyl ligase-like protein
MKHLLLSAALLLPGLAAADEISDALTAAQEAYADGDIQYALDELDFARNKLLEAKTNQLGSFLPEAPDGWTREVSSEMNQGLAMMGGGVGAEATYTSGSGDESYKITLMADNPMVASMAAMVTNAAAMGFQVERVGRQRFMVQDNEMTGLVANRFLVQISGADPETMTAALESMNFAALAGFGQ